MSAKVQGWVWDLADVLPQRRLVLLWLANRATDNGVCFPGQAEVRRKTGLGEKMVRRHLHWLASELDDEGSPKPPLLTHRRAAHRYRPQHEQRVCAARSVGPA